MSVHYQSDGPVAVLTIDRPEVANAIDRPTAQQLVAAQEAGTRPARALPYELHVNGQLQSQGYALTFANTGTQGAHFWVYTGDPTAMPRRYTVEAGKAADVVIWNGNPFSVYALAEQVFIDGALKFDRAHRPLRPRSDFLLGRHIAEAPL